MLLLIIGLSANAQQKIQLRSADRAECTKSDMNGLKASFSFSTIEAEDYSSDRGTFSWLSLPNTVRGGNEGDPQIPVINQLIAVPVGAQPRIEITSYSSTDYNLADYGMKTLVPRQPSLRKDKHPKDVPFVMNEAAYLSTRNFKGEPTAMVSVEGTMRGIRLGKMTIEPVNYDPVNNKIRVFNDIEVTIHFDGADAAATEQMLIDTYSPYFDIVYKQLFNGRAITSVYDDHPDLYTTPVKMLVVTTSTYANSTAFQNWLTWKKQKGIDVDVQTVANGASASTIKNLIYSRYNTNHPSFLVIVGDETVVTYYSLWDYDSSYGNAATDLEYASVDGDIYHDMFISRMPVSSTTELANLVNKTLTYEKYTMSDPSYLNETLLIAGWDDDGATAYIGKPTIQYANNYYFNSDHGITPHVFITTGTGQTTCYNYINNVGFVNYTAHGDIQKWHDPQFTNTNVNNLTNNDKYFWAMGNCCLTANFKNASNNQTCFGETMVRAANKGAFGYIGSVPESLWYEDYYFALGATNTFQNMPTQSQTQTGAYDALFDDTGFNTLNSVPYIGNVAVSYAYSGNYNTSGSNSTTYEEYYWRAYQCYGDGSVMPYLKMPAANNVSHASNIAAGTNSFRVYADAKSYVSITVNNEIIGVAAVPANATYVDVPFTTTPSAGQTAMIVVTRNQRQPYINDNVPVINSGTQYTISYMVNPTNAGTVEGAGQYYENTPCTLTAVPNYGYVFAHWNDYSAVNPLTFTVTGDATYTATFRPLQQHQITYTSQMAHGTISVSPENAIMGDIVTLTATPDPGFVLDYWDVNTVSKGNVPVENNQFVMPDQAVTVSATFKVAAPENLTVYGDNTTTNEYVPIYGYWADSKSKCEFIIPSEKIAAMNGGRISAMKFYLSSSGDDNEISATFDVFVKEVSTTTLTGYTGSSDATAVFSNTITIAANASNVELDIPFTSDYVYSGGNLLVGFYQTGSTADYNHTNWVGETQDNNTAWAGYGNTGSGKKFLPKTTFTYEKSTAPGIILPGTATVVTGSTTTLTATTLNVTGTPSITYASSNTSVATVTGSGTTATVTGVTAGTANITATMTYNSNTYTSTCAVTVEDPSYCTPGTGGFDIDGIYNVTFGTNGVVVNNTVSGIDYGDYSNLVGAVDAGTNGFEVAITYKTDYTYGTIIWVDWNKNYTFEGATEVVYAGQSGSTNPSTLTATFDVPSTTPRGDYRMRIIGADMALDSYTGSLSDAAGVDACGSYSYSTCHDYTLRVNAGAYHITCNATTNGTLLADKTLADENETVTVTATPETDYVLTALTYTPEGGTAQNINISSIPYTFTMPAANVTVNATFTLPACPRPTNVTASNLTHNSAHISWDGNADSYNVKYATAAVTGITLEQVFFDGFENGIDNWTTYALGNYTSDGTNWHQFDATSFSSGNVTNHTGNYVAMSRSYNGSQDVSVDNWLVSPQMTLGDVVKFWVDGDDSNFQEYYAVYVSTGTNAISDFTMVEAPELAPGDGSWAERTVDLSAYAGQQGYIAIRHTDYAKDYLLIDDFGVYNTVNAYTYGTFTTLPPTTETSCDIAGLSPETFYVAQVQSDCGSTDGTSGWSSVYFTTPDACSAPINLVTSNITANTATLSWSDNQDSYNVQYRKFYFFEGFEGETLPTGWTSIDANEDGNTWSVGHATTHSGNNGAANISYIYNTSGTTPDDYLVSPQLDLQGTLRVWLSGFGDDHEEHFEILLSTTGNSVSDFTTTLVGETTTSNTYVEYTANLSSYAGQQGYIAIHHFNCQDQRYLYVDDFGLYGSENWVSITPNPTDATVTLTGLQSNTGYEWQVQGLDCNTSGSSTDWSSVATFTTAYPSFTLGIDAWDEGDGWYLIASPLAGDVAPTEVGNLVAGTADNFDLYRFNQTAEQEWENYKKEGDHYHFDLEPGKGYLYANAANVTLTFTGVPYSGDGKVTVTNVEGHRLSGWNLIGNPWSTTATIGREFLRMNGYHNEIIPAEDPNIAPMEGVFVYTDENSETVTFSKASAKAFSNDENIVLNLSHNGGNIIDRAIVRFGEGSTLPKLQIRDNSTKLYFTQDGRDYAVIRTDGQCEIPVNFMASENGEYTLTISETIQSPLDNLHLIDNMTGADIDLLATPSYTFNAKTTDYASRFKLVFATSDADDDNFAFINNGQLIVTGEGTLQVFDVLGRQLYSNANFQHSTTHFPAGVYVLRLVNGESVKTQKIVIMH